MGTSDKADFVVGSKQTARALQKKEVATLYLARDAEKKVIEPLVELATANGADVVYVDSMKLLGEEFKVKIGAAAAAVLHKEE